MQVPNADQLHLVMSSKSSIEKWLGDNCLSHESDCTQDECHTSLKARPDADTSWQSSNDFSCGRGKEHASGGGHCSSTASTWVICALNGCSTRPATRRHEAGLARPRSEQPQRMAASAVAADAISGWWSDIHLYKRIASFADQWPVGPTECQKIMTTNLKQSNMQNDFAQNHV